MSSSDVSQNASKSRLSEKLEELMRQGRRDAIAVDRAPDELDEVQQATDRELTLAVIERESALTHQVRLALRRLEHGTYGKCIRCNKRIGARRLKALPWASMCLPCQGQAEAERERTNGRHADAEQDGVRDLKQ